MSVKLLSELQTLLKGRKSWTSHTVFFTFHLLTHTLKALFVLKSRLSLAVIPEHTSSLRQSAQSHSNFPCWSAPELAFMGLLSAGSHLGGTYLVSAAVYSMCWGGWGANMEARVEDLLFVWGFALVSTYVLTGLEWDQAPPINFSPPYIPFPSTRCSSCGEI